MKCRRCGRGLKNPKAIAARIGPVCARKEAAELANREADRDVLLPSSEDVILRKLPDGAVATNIPHAVVLHSPTGYGWGYGGSGPADLALNILLHYGASREDAELLHQDFKWQFITPMPKEGGTIKGETVRAWIIAHTNKEVAA